MTQRLVSDLLALLKSGVTDVFYQDEAADDLLRCAPVCSSANSSSAVVLMRVQISVSITLLGGSLGFVVLVLFTASFL